MPLDMQYFRAIHSSVGCNTSKDRKVREFQTRFARDFDTSINAVYDATRNEVPQDFIITPIKTGCHIIARPGESISIGDIIFYNTLHWLVTDIDFQDELTCCGDMVRCNRQIRWQNTKTGEIVERWCLATKPYTSNIDTGVVVSTSNREYKIQIPYDAETRLVDIDKRFLLEKVGESPKAYTVTSVDTLTNRYEDIDGGFLIWNLTQGEYNPEMDNAELMIADYVAPGEEPPAPPAHLLPCSISGKSTIRCGMSRTYTAKFFLTDGVTEDSSVVAVWTVTPPAGFESAVSWQANGNYIVLMVGDDEALSGEFIQISVSDDKCVYQSDILSVEVVGLV